MSESRALFLERQLKTLRYYNALRALDQMKEEMCKGKGFYRKGDGSHYYYHLVDVAQLILTYGIHDETTIVSALLHDWAEDVDGVTIEVVKRTYGDDVATVVSLLTKFDGLDYNDPEVLTDYLEKIKLNWRAAVIKTADRIHNFSTLKGVGWKKKMKQAAQTEKYFIPFFKACRNLYPRYEDFFFSAKTRIEPHLWEIKEHFEEVTALETRIKELEKQEK